MRGKEILRGTLRRIDGRGYKAYSDIKGTYDFDAYTLTIDYVQADPFAPPSQIIVRVPHERAAFPAVLFSNPVRTMALEDFLTRRFYSVSGRERPGSRGTGKSGLVSIDKPPQEVIKRTSVLMGERGVEARFVVGLPARGRTVLGRQAAEIFFEVIPKLVTGALFYKSLDARALEEHVKVVEDADFIRGKLHEKGLVAFIADGSVLPRMSGVDDRPLKGGNVVAFKTPEALRVGFETPNRGVVTGMGVPRGITLIVGGGYHGKSTLLNAMEKGIYDHVAGDGREYVVSDRQAVKIRAEDGRSIENVDISPFINDLPFGQDTHSFSTSDASGSTSQAANIIEALEAGARVLLIDEDTSATNFMIRDGRMQRLVAKAKEPITPFIDKVKQLYASYGVSTVIVMGGTGDYFEVADTVIMMDEYVPRDVTAEAKEIAKSQYIHRAYEGGDEFGAIKPRHPLPGSLDASRGRKEVKISAKGLHSIMFGYQHIDLSFIEQLADISQTRAIGDIIHYARENYMDGKKSINEILSLLEKDLTDRGLDILSPYLRGDYALPRMLEVAAALNRLRTLRCK
jgi:predicted ABC-class ATPase